MLSSSLWCSHCLHCMNVPQLFHFQATGPSEKAEQRNRDEVVVLLALQPIMSLRMMSSCHVVMLVTTTLQLLFAAKGISQVLNFLINISGFLFLGGRDPNIPTPEKSVSRLIANVTTFYLWTTCNAVLSSTACTGGQLQFLSRHLRALSLTSLKKKKSRSQQLYGLTAAT